jgi:hypothetical protein
VVDSVYARRFRAPSDRAAVAAAYAAVFSPAAAAPVAPAADGSAAAVAGEALSCAPFTLDEPCDCVDVEVSPTLLRVGTSVLARYPRPATATPPPGPIPRALHAPLQVPPHALMAVFSFPLDFNPRTNAVQDLARCVRHGWCALLVGGPSTGKSSLVRTLASLVSRAFVSVKSLLAIEKINTKS